MKSMLYAGAALMIGASVYGFVDYKQTHSKKEFKEMYSEKKATGTVPEVTTGKPVTAAEKTTAGTTKPVALKKKAADSKTAIAPVQPIPAEEKLITDKKNLMEEPVVTVEPSRESAAVKTVKKKRKVRKELFSRAPLRDEEEVLIEPAKKEEKKTASKEL